MCVCRKKQLSCFILDIVVVFQLRPYLFSHSSQVHCSACLHSDVVILDTLIILFFFFTVPPFVCCRVFNAVTAGILVNMLKKEKQRNGTTKMSDTSSPGPSTPPPSASRLQSAPVGNRKWTLGQQSIAVDRDERTKNVICQSLFICVICNHKYRHVHTQYFKR